MRFGVKAFPGKKTARTLLPKVEQYLDTLSADCRPDTLAVEDVHYAQARLSPLLGLLTNRMKRWARRKRVRVLAYLPTTVKESFCKGRLTRRALAEAMAQRYWLLSRFLKRNYTQHTQLYWQQMFDAVALGTLAVKVARSVPGLLGRASGPAHSGAQHTFLVTARRAHESPLVERSLSADSSGSTGYSSLSPPRIPMSKGPQGKLCGYLPRAQATTATCALPLASMWLLSECALADF